MITSTISTSSSFQSVNRAFSKQSNNYDREDLENRILQDLRAQVYAHVNKFLKPQSRILELNAGTGIDALHFAQQKHSVHATDVSDGMIQQIEKKIRQHNFSGELTCQQLSFDNLKSIQERQFDYVFSNMGGLNCIEDLTKVTSYLPSLLNANATVTWVIMPPVCPVELSTALKGNFKHAFRRLKKHGVLSHLEGEYFNTYYHSLSDLKKSFGEQFKLITTEGLAAVCNCLSFN